METFNGYDVNVPFDNLNIIFKTICGNPKYTFKCNESDLICAYDKNDKMKFAISNSTFLIDNEYAENAIIYENLTEFKEYGKLFTFFGSSLLSMLSLITILSNINKKEHHLIFNHITFTNEYLLSFKKLGIAFSKAYDKYLSCSME